MRGIIYKDFLVAIMPKNLLSTLANIAVSIAVVYYFDNMYGMALVVALALPLSGSSLLQISMEQDELCSFDKIQLTFPLTKKQIILSKYLGGFIMQLMFYVISLAVAYYYYMLGVASLTIALQVWVLGVIVGLIFFSMSYVGFYLLGNKKGTIMYFAFMIIACVVYIMTYFNFDMFSILTMDYNVLLLIGLIVAVGMVVISYLLSVKIYTKRFS